MINNEATYLLGRILSKYLKFYNNLKTNRWRLETEYELKWNPESYKKNICIASFFKSIIGFI